MHSWHNTHPFVPINRYHTNLLTIFHIAVTMVTKKNQQLHSVLLTLPCTQLNHHPLPFPSLHPPFLQNTTTSFPCLDKHVETVTSSRLNRGGLGMIKGGLFGGCNLAVQPCNYHISMKAGVTELLSSSLEPDCNPDTHRG